jgi:hypothetical protein
MTGKRDGKEPAPEAQVRSCIARLEPKSQKLIRSVRAAVRRLFPAATELAYDYNHSFVISYSPTENGVDAILAISARAAGVFLYFSQGPKLPDPGRILLGSGRQVRFVQVNAASQLAQPEVAALIAAAVDQARIPFPSRGKGRLIIKSAAGKKRSRRRPTK